MLNTNMMIGTGIINMWLVVDKDGTEKCSRIAPKRFDDHWEYFTCDDGNKQWNICHKLELKSIKELLGYEMTWEDNPVYYE